MTIEHGEVDVRDNKFVQMHSKFALMLTSWLLQGQGNFSNLKAWMIFLVSKIILKKISLQL